MLKLENNMKSFCIIGLGRFGRALAETLAAAKKEVLFFFLVLKAPTGASGRGLSHLARPFFSIFRKQYTKTGQTNTKRRALKPAFLSP